MTWPLPHPRLTFFPALRRRTRRSRLSFIDKLAICAVFVLLALALIGPFITPHDPYRVDLNQSLAAPSLDHLLGTDSSGRDVLSRILQGARLSIFGAIITVTLAATIGVAVAAVATLGGRWADDIIMRICDIALSLPVMVMALGIAVALGPSLRSAIIAMVISWWPGFARLARAEMHSTMTSTYVESATVMGVSKPRLMWRHVLPNSLDGVYVQATLEIGGATLIMAGLSFIGAGAQPPSAEWGAMVESGARFMTTSWWVVVFPGLAITITALAFAIAGDALRNRNHPDVNAS